MKLADLEAARAKVYADYAQMSGYITDHGYDSISGPCLEQLLNSLLDAVDAYIAFQSPL